MSRKNTSALTNAPKRNLTNATATPINENTTRITSANCIDSLLLKPNDDAGIAVKVALLIAGRVPTAYVRTLSPLIHGLTCM